MRTTALLVAAFAALSSAAPYADEYADYNLNTNKDAQTPLQYSTTPSGKFTPSPDNWRAIPFYTLLPDKWANGDPTNDDYFETMFESDWRETQLRVGGDVAGMAARLDYLQGMGIKGIFMSGTLFLNMLWQADSALIVAAPPPCAD
jgi:alpha-1,3-glucan synthase